MDMDMSLSMSGALLFVGGGHYLWGGLLSRVGVIAVGGSLLSMSGVWWVSLFFIEVSGLSLSVGVVVVCLWAVFIHGLLLSSVGGAWSSVRGHHPCVGCHHHSWGRLDPVGD